MAILPIPPKGARLPTIHAVGVSVRHALSRALATANLAPAEASFRIEGARVSLDRQRRVVRAEITVRTMQPRPIADWGAADIHGLVNPDGQHPLMVRVPGARPFYLDIFPVSWNRWLRRRDDTLPPFIDPLCPRTDVGLAQSKAFAADNGKRLPRTEELIAVWGSTALPWGTSPDSGLGRVRAPRYGELPEIGMHPPTQLGVFDLGAWLWHWTAEGTLFGGAPMVQAPASVAADDGLVPVGLRLAQDG